MDFKEGNPRARRASGHAAETPDSSYSGKVWTDADPVPYRKSREPRRRSMTDAETSVSRLRRTSEENILAYSAKRRKRKKIIRGVFIAAIVLVLAGAGTAFAYFTTIQKNLNNGIDEDLLNSLSAVDAPTDPFYVLLLGVDGSADRESSEEYEGDNFRSDSMILARVDPKDKKATLVSIKRDLMIEKMGRGKYGTQKINAAHAFGGPALAVDTVTELAGVPIAHYAEMNFDGFKDVVDALGGVEVNVPIEIDDEFVDDHLMPGVQTLNGSQALSLCRSRHSYDDYGDGDGYRAANQRMVLAAIAQKMLASDPITIANTLTKLSEAVITDLKLNEIIGIAQTMRGINMETDIYSGVIPCTPDMIDDIWYDILDKTEWKAMMARVDAGKPPTEETIIDPLTGTVLSTAGEGGISGSGPKAVDRTTTIRVRNGNGNTGACESAEQKLKEAGYKNFDLGNADAFDYETTLIVYKEDDGSGMKSHEADAEAIQQILGVGEVQPNDDTFLFESDVLLVLGADWKI